MSAMGLKHSALRFLERTADFSEVEKFEGKGLSCMPKIDYKVQVNTKKRRAVLCVVLIAVNMEGEICVIPKMCFPNYIGGRITWIK